MQVVTSTTVEISWEPPLEQDHNGDIESYTVIVFEVTTNTTLQIHENVTSMSLTLSSLHPSYEYMLSLAAYTVDVGPFKSITVTTEQAGKFKMTNSVSGLLLTYSSLSSS